MSKTITISDETYDFLKQLSKDMKEQDNRYTPSPYFYVIRGEKKLVAPEGFGDEEWYSSEAERSFKTEEEMKEYCQENEEDFETFKDDCTVYGSQIVPEHHNFFLTEKGAKKHMELNGHNYRHYEKVYDYVDFAFRNPEVESLFKAIHEIGEL